MNKDTETVKPRFAIIKGLRYDFDKSVKIAMDKRFMLMPEYKESIRPVLLKTQKGNYFLCWENTDGDISTFQALNRKAAFKWCCDMDVLAAEKEFPDLIQEG